VAPVSLLLLDVLRAALADEEVAAEALDLLVEDEDEAAEAAHAAVVVEVLLLPQNLHLLVLLRDLLFDLGESEFLVLPQFEVPLDDLEDPLALLLRQMRQIQRVLHRSRHALLHETRLLLGRN